MKISSGTENTNVNVHDVLYNSRSYEDNSKPYRRTTREKVLEASEEFYDDEQKRMVAEDLLRLKRAEHKSEINLPPGYSIYEIPKLPDKSPMPVFLHFNISKILDWDELNEVIILNNN